MKKLYRSRTNRIIAGVCGGLGEYFGIDSTLIRIGFVVLVFFSGFGILLYLALWLIVPLEGSESASLNKEHLTKVGAEMKEKAEEVAGEVKETVAEIKKKAKSKK